ncbi:MAG: SpoIIE family protein phosphatase [Bacteroidota bacterium]|nr:SpoIIE family protein phosphatase [Bacteroidota bacterium]MDP3145768.1 SpoIIE family protein phosphatase [Bacteroidota bacterium]
MQTISDLVLDKLNTLVVVVNNKGEVEYISNSSKAILGFDSSQLLGDNWWIIPRLNITDGYAVKEKIISIMLHDSYQIEQGFEHALKTSNGLIKWFKWSSAITDDDKVIGIGIDITEKKKAEQRALEINKTLTDKNKEITDSISYAKKIQQAILQSDSFLKTNFKDGFVLYLPKDIVSGDYYFFYENEEFKYVAAIDCTGHGVPGALMSVIANSLLKEVFYNKNLVNPDEVLYALDELLFDSLNKNNSEEIRYDGMDISLCAINKKTNILNFAGAMRPLFIVSDNELIEIKGSKFPLGYYFDKKEFILNTIQLKENDRIYLTTDGYADQFGGSKNKKLNRKAFKELLLSLEGMDGDEQNSFLDYSLKNWKQDAEQTDDVLVIGIFI